MTLFGFTIWKLLIAWAAGSVIVSVLAGLIFEDRYDKWLINEKDYDDDQET